MSQKNTIYEEWRIGHGNYLRIYEDGILRTEPCSRCGTTTSFLEMNFETYICPEYCGVVLEEEYWEEEILRKPKLSEYAKSRMLAKDGPKAKIDRSKLLPFQGADGTIYYPENDEKEALYPN